MSLEPKEVDSLQEDRSQTALYERYGQVIFGYLRLHMHSPEDAEDLLLEVFLAALEHDNLSAFSPGEHLAWLRRVAHNKLANVYRRASRSPQVALDAIVETCGRISKNFPHCNSKSYSYAMETDSAVLKLPCYSINVREPCANFSHAALSFYVRSIGKPKERAHARS